MTAAKGCVRVSSLHVCVSLCLCLCLSVFVSSLYVCLSFCVFVCVYLACQWPILSNVRLFSLFVVVAGALLLFLLLFLLSLWYLVHLLFGTQKKAI